MKALGKNPISTHRMERILNSPNYRNGIFRNVNPTSMNKPGGSTLKTIWEFILTERPQDARPLTTLTGVRTNLHQVADSTPTVIWFGHSSYLIKFQGLNILVDPVFSGHASPLSTAVRAFSGTDLYSVDDLPKIDHLILTHDHYDHIDYLTVARLRAKTEHVICPLGVGEHLEYWGFLQSQFTEMDWWESSQLPSAAKITAVPARHFSGRGLSRNKTLWSAFALELGEWKIFIGGDSGYDDQFKKIGDSFGRFDLAMIECGQYGENWPFIHMFPEQTVQAAMDLKAEVLFPVHWGKFMLSLHSWTEPIERALVKGIELNQKIATPRIGEVFRLGENLPSTKWWRDLG